MKKVKVMVVKAEILIIQLIVLATVIMGILTLITCTGCEEQQQIPVKPEIRSVFLPIKDVNFVKVYGDTDDARISYNLIRLDYIVAQKLADVNDRLTKLESEFEPTNKQGIAWRTRFIIPYDPDDPNSIEDRLKKLELSVSDILNFNDPNL